MADMKFIIRKCQWNSVCLMFKSVINVVHFVGILYSCPAIPVYIEYITDAVTKKWSFKLEEYQKLGKNGFYR